MDPVFSITSITSVLQSCPARTDRLAGVRTSTRTANGHGAEARIDAHLIDMGIFVLQAIASNIRPMVPAVELNSQAKKHPSI